MGDSRQESWRGIQPYGMGWDSWHSSICSAGKDVFLTKEDGCPTKGSTKMAGEFIHCISWGALMRYAANRSIEDILVDTAKTCPNMSRPQFCNGGNHHTWAVEKVTCWGLQFEIWKQLPNVHGH